LTHAGDEEVIRSPEGRDRGSREEYGVLVSREGTITALARLKRVSIRILAQVLMAPGADLRHSGEPARPHRP